MPKKTQLFIADPCHEHWGNMQPDANGRFCSSCARTVVDFTTMSDQEVLTWLSGAGKSVCGRFMEDQLNRDLVPARRPQKSRWALWQFLLAGLLISSEVSAQEKTPDPPVIRFDIAPPDTNVRVILGGIRSRPTDEKPDRILLLIVDAATGQALPGASIHVGKASFVTDTTGAVVIARKDLLAARKLQISYVGYEPRTVSLDKKFLSQAAQVLPLALHAQVLGEVAVVSYGKTTCRRTTGMVSVVRRTYTLQDTLAFFGLAKTPLTVYPNPVARGASATLSIKGRPGTYMAQLFSNAGALIESMRIEGVDGQRTELLNFPSSLAAGLYYIRLAHEQTGKVYTQKVEVL